LVEIQQVVREVTAGAITSVRSPKMRAWVEHRVGPEARKLMIVYKDGEAKVSIDKTVRGNLLALADENPDEVPPDVAEVIQCADDLWASSVAKFNRAAALADKEDSRVRGAFVFAGGAATGRASSYGLQVHNFPRKCAAAPDDVRHSMVRGHQIVPTHGKRVTDVLKGMLRPAMMPSPGKVLAAADWSAIEARVNPWLSGNGEAKLELFRTGQDVYKVNAAATFRVSVDEVTKDQRQVGKVQELACGFAGGVGAFAAMGRVYGVHLPESEARRMVDAWRRANPWAVPFWQALENAYTRAMRNRGHEFSAGLITYLFDGTHLWYALPSGRVLYYPFAKLEADGVTYAKASWKPAADATEWPRARLWRGLACIAKDTPVLTDRGWVPIQNVSREDKIWDGDEWVCHEGLAHQGYGRVILAHGVSMTPDHLVLTVEGWVRADESERYCRAASGVPDSGDVGGVGREKVHLADTLRLRGDAQHEAAKLHEIGPRSAPGFVWVPQEIAYASRAYDARHDAASRLCSLALNAWPLFKAVSSGVEKLRRAGYFGLRRVANFCRFLARHGHNLSAGSYIGPRGQQRPLQPCELSVGDTQNAGEEQTLKRIHIVTPRILDGGGNGGKNRVERDDFVVPNTTGGDGRGFVGASEQYAEVFDLVNCGPRRRFVVQDASGGMLIVHNCENVTQAAAHDLLRASLRRLEAEGQEVVLHVHDEIVCETADPDATVAAMRRAMCTPPNWAGGIPLDIEAEVMTRYGKG